MRPKDLKGHDNLRAANAVRRRRSATACHSREGGNPALVGWPLPTARLIPQPRFPFIWVLRAVKDRVDNDALRLNCVKDHIGESADKGTAIIGEHSRIHRRMSLDRGDRGLDITHEQEDSPQLDHQSATTVNCLPATNCSNLGRKELDTGSQLCTQ